MGQIGDLDRFCALIVKAARGDMGGCWYRTSTFPGVLE